MTWHSIVLAVALCLLAGSAGAKEHRSRWVPQAFQRSHPCPSTGRKTGACPGWIKDHIIPLCAGGPDTVANLQWQTSRRGEGQRPRGVEAMPDAAARMTSIEGLLEGCGYVRF
jgi:hypothetical protein